MKTRELVKLVLRENRIYNKYIVNLPEADEEEIYKVLCNKDKKFSAIYKNIKKCEKELELNQKKVWAVGRALCSSWGNSNKMDICINKRLPGQFAVRVFNNPYYHYGKWEF